MPVSLYFGPTPTGRIASSAAPAMASKKKSHPSKVCRIFQWVEAQDDRFAGAIRDLCMEGTLSPSFGAGVTFLYPKDAGYRNEISDAAYDDGDKAVQGISSLIIPSFLPNASSFLQQPIGSHGGVLFEVEDATGSTVRLKGGVTLEKATNFQLLRSTEEKGKGNQAVWIVTSGRLPTTGAPYTRPKSRGKKGGAVADGARLGGASDRAANAMQLEKEFDACMKKDGCVARDPYLARVVSLLHFLRASHPDVLQAVLPLIDYNPIVTYYLLLEPYKRTGNFILDDGILFGSSGWNGAEMFTDAVAEYKAFFGMLGSETGSPAKVFSDHAGIVRAVDHIRQSSVLTATDRLSLPRAIEKAYANLVDNNTIDGQTPIYPDGTLALLRTPGKKIWQDEFRFVVSAKTQPLFDAARSSSGNRYDSADWEAVVRLVRSERPGNDYANEASLIGKVLMKSNVGPTADFAELSMFGKSTDFLYTPAPEGMVGGYIGSGDDPTDMAVYNRNFEAHRTMSRSRTRRSQGVSPQALTELRMYAARYGGDLSGLLGGR